MIFEGVCGVSRNTLPCPTNIGNTFPCPTNIGLPCPTNIGKTGTSDIGNILSNISADIKDNIWAESPKLSDVWLQGITEVEHVEKG